MGKPCTHCGVPSPYGHSYDCPLDHSCIRNDGGVNPKCSACEREQQEAEALAQQKAEELERYGFTDLLGNRVGPGDYVVYVSGKVGQLTIGRFVRCTSGLLTVQVLRNDVDGLHAGRVRTVQLRNPERVFRYPATFVPDVLQAALEG